MASRDFIQFQFSLEKKWVSLFATVKFNATNASPTLQQWVYGGFGNVSGAGAPGYSAAATSGFKGFGAGTAFPGYTTPILYNSAGNYTVYLQDRYVRVLGFQVTYMTAAVSAAPQYSVPNASVNLTGTYSTTPTGIVYTVPPSIVVQYYNSSGVATSPASGEVHLWALDLADSSAP